MDQKLKKIQCSPDLYEEIKGFAEGKNLSIKAFVEKALTTAMSFPDGEITPDAITRERHDAIYQQGWDAGWKDAFHKIRGEYETAHTGRVEHFEKLWETILRACQVYAGHINVKQPYRL